MLIHPMVERLRGLGLTAMADAFIEMQNASAADDLSREDWLGLLLEREATTARTSGWAAGCGTRDCGRAR